MDDDPYISDHDARKRTQENIEPVHEGQKASCSIIPQRVTPHYKVGHENREESHALSQYLPGAQGPAWSIQNYVTSSSMSLTTDSPADKRTNDLSTPDVDIAWAERRHIITR